MTKPDTELLSLDSTRSSQNSESRGFFAPTTDNHSTAKTLHTLHTPWGSNTARSSCYGPGPMAKRNASCIQLRRPLKQRKLIIDPGRKNYVICYIITEPLHHTSTGIPPATKLPQIPPPPPKTRDSSIRDKDDASKRKMKENMDSKRYVEPTNLSEGDMVLAKREPSYKKLATPYDPNPHIVSQHKGAMIPAQRADKELTRN